MLSVKKKKGNVLFVKYFTVGYKVNIKDCLVL